MRTHLVAVAFAAASCLLATGVAVPTPPDLLKTPEEEALSDAHNKYFHEPGEEEHLHHYDARFFKRVVSSAEREVTLQHMIRAYLNTFREKGIETWIAHGTLLGWWWNGRMLPWDWDVDVQISDDTLDYLAKHMNGTTHDYLSEDGSFQRSYFLDVNPWFWERDRGDGMNVIDARWIDVQNGLFIDITALTETHPDNTPGVLSCKNYHRYWTEDLYPMRESEIEGVIVKIPFAYDRILTDEYETSALFVTEYEGHTWDPQSKTWIKTPEEQVLTKVKTNQKTSYFANSLWSRSTEPGLKNILQLVTGS